MMTTAALLGATAVLGGCAGAPAGSGGEGSEPPPAADAESELAGFATILQEADNDPELCLGGVMESYPPQCGGPVLVGLAWEDVADAETAGGTTWGSGWVVGTYDVEEQTFTLTRPVSAEAPEGASSAQPGEVAFPALCDDPYVGGDEAFDATTADAMAAQEELMAAASGLDGYVGLYVSDGANDHVNVLVQDDPEGAHAALREVWSGWLCVGTSAGASEADMLAAQQAVQDALPAGTVLGSAPDSTTGLLQVQVVVADEATTQAVRDAVAPWLTAEQVVVSGALAPLA